MDQLDADQPAGSTIGDEPDASAYVDGFCRNANGPGRSRWFLTRTQAAAPLPLAMPKERLTQAW